MRKILTIAAAAAVLAGAAYAVSAGGEKTTEGAARVSCGAHAKAARFARGGEGGAACCQKGAAASKGAACTARHDKEVALTGTVVCEMCDLHRSKSCTPAFKAEGRDAALRICTTTKDVPALTKAGEVQVKGYVHPGPDGRDEIEVISFNKKPTKA
jgi:hypothetical protein